ncbi:hypothetical protein [Streptomyces sp. NPDC096311]|uniref:hypothetical protein n=1 Tax=Streptomyces sp. NPDC096311 TaxID=3366083 RepID=UPI003820E64C
MRPSDALRAGSVANAVFIDALPAVGMLSDRLRRRPWQTMLAADATVLAFPLDRLIQGQSWQLIVAMSVGLLLMSPASGPGPAMYAELFPTRVRATGFGLPNAVAVALAGGTAHLCRPGCRAMAPETPSSSTPWRQPVREPGGLLAGAPLKWGGMSIVWVAPTARAHGKLWVCTAMRAWTNWVTFLEAVDAPMDVNLRFRWALQGMRLS